MATKFIGAHFDQRHLANSTAVKTHYGLEH